MHSALPLRAAQPPRLRRHSGERAQGGRVHLARTRRRSHCRRARAEAGGCSDRAVAGGRAGVAALPPRESGSSKSALATHGALPRPACGERVGVRGPRRPAENPGGCLYLRRFDPHRSESRRGPLTLVAPLLDLSPHAGRGEQTNPFSRRVFAPEFCKTPSREARRPGGKRQSRGGASLVLFATPVSPIPLM
jgi:hypothetical protein